MSPSVISDALAYDDLKSSRQSLLAFQALSPSLEIHTSDSPQFNSLRGLYNIDVQTKPLAICRPTTPSEVSQIIRFCSNAKIPLTVRSGGHDPWGRSSIQNGVVIDVRTFDSLNVAEDRKSARIGGGILSSKVLEGLDKLGLMTPTGTCPSVGYVNWACCGGYGFMCGTHGMGVDQILGAKIVRADGEIVEADGELLWGLKGAGGNFGVIVELTIKVYESHKILGGLVAFPFAGGMQVIEGFRELVAQDHPRPFSGDLMCASIPGAGLAVSVLYSWTDQDLKSGEAYLAKILALGTPMFNSVVESSILEFQMTFNQFLPARCYYKVKSACVPGLTTQFNEIFLRNPPTDGLYNTITWHTSHGKSTQQDDTCSFANRKQHLLLEIVCVIPIADRKCIESAYEWIDKRYSDIAGSGFTSKAGYANLMGKDESQREIYGANWERLLALKRAVDPDNLFASAIPCLKSED